MPDVPPAEGSWLNVCKKDQFTWLTMCRCLNSFLTAIRAAIADEEIEELINDVEPAKECCFTLHMKCFSERKANGKAASSHASMVASTKGMTYEVRTEVLFSIQIFKHL